MTEKPLSMKEITATIREAQQILNNLKEHHSKALLLCLSSELRKWEWAEEATFSEDESGLRTCLVCGASPSPSPLDDEFIES